MKRGTWSVNFKIEMNGIEIDFNELPKGVQKGILMLVKDGHTEGCFSIANEKYRKAGEWDVRHE